MTSNGNSEREPSSLLNRIIFRSVQPTDIPRCHQIEAASYPEGEAASKSQLQYRQHHAAQYFRCAFLISDDDVSGGGTTSTTSSICYRGQHAHLGSTLRGSIIGFVCSTRCKAFTEDAMKVHDGSGKILAIHSVVVEEKYRNAGVASAMIQDYISAMERLNNKGSLKVGMEKIVLIAKKNLLAFYVRNGMTATGLSPIVHGKDQWFELERKFEVGGRGGKTNSCFLVDSFADIAKQGSGNPAGVVILDGPPVTAKEESGNESDSENSLDDIMEEEEFKKISRGEEWMAIVAKEFNQSETAFAWPLPPKTALKDGENSSQLPSYAIRYFTRTGVEVDLCGHATLATAAVLLLPKKMEDSKHNHKVSFSAKKDDLQAELLAPCSNSQHNHLENALRITMTFPWKNVRPISTENGDNSREIVLAMIKGAFISCRNDPTSLSIGQHVLFMGTTDTNEDLMIELTEEGFDLLMGGGVCSYDALFQWNGYSRGVIICCCASKTPEATKQTTPAVDFRSRFFGPKVGIDEDPVTGSAHCSLGPYFGNKLGKTKVLGRQESDRGGLVECILKPDEGRVCIVGTAVVTVSGNLSMAI